jgi:hypothetical protein
MPLAPVVIASIIGGGASLAGGALASRNRNTQSSAPVYDAQSQGLRDLVYAQISKRLGQGAPDLTGYKANGIADINHTFDLVGQSQAKQSDGARARHVADRRHRRREP